MRRREFIGGVAGAAAWPVIVHGKPPAIPVVGYLDSLGPQTGAPEFSAFRKALSNAGYVDGRNMSIELRWAEGQSNRLPALAADLVRRRVAVIVTVSDPAAALAAKAATKTIPIVFTCSADPVEAGVVASLNRPGGNATGVSYFVPKLGPMRLEWLREFVPHAAAIAVLAGPTHQSKTQSAISDMEADTRDGPQQLIALSAGTTTEIDAAFATMAKRQAGGLIVNDDRFLSGQRDQLIALAARYQIPAIYFTRAFAEAGGLMSYGDDRPQSWRLAADYVGRILKGDMPAALPVIRPIKLELVVNLKTAASLGLPVPRRVLVFADQLIQ
jgi:putative tryptophan/tyrosine transport system substrate-binding protein